MFNNAVCSVKHINADHLESLVVEKLSESSRRVQGFVLA
jgi:hypothetical protein